MYLQHITLYVSDASHAWGATCPHPPSGVTDVSCLASPRPTRHNISTVRGLGFLTTHELSSTSPDFVVTALRFHRIGVFHSLLWMILYGVPCDNVKGAKSQAFAYSAARNRKGGNQFSRVPFIFSHALSPWATQVEKRGRIVCI